MDEAPNGLEQFRHGFAFDASAAGLGRALLLQHSILA